MSSFSAEVDRFLASAEANFGLATLRAQQLISKIASTDDEAYKYFVHFILPSKGPITDKEEQHVAPATNIEERAAMSYRAMNILKQDLSGATSRPMLVKGPTQAGLLVKDLLLGLTTVVSNEAQRYSNFHIRELLDALVEAYPEKAMSAAAAGGKQGAQDHLGPLLQSDQTLSVLTHLVCIGATGRKGIASAEKSAQHTAMYHHMYNDPRNKISLGQRRKFVKVMSDFSLIDQLAHALASKSAGEELCDCILTIVEVIGYPPEEPQSPGLQQQQQDKEKAKDEMVGEDILLAPLARAEWWRNLFEILHKNDCTYEQREAICRACNHVFALATGNSSRICKSHAPATDATEQASEKLVEEKEEKVVNRLVEWGLTDSIHSALRSQIPLLIQILNLPSENILSHQATHWKSAGDEIDSGESDTISIPHPGKYRTQPLGSWRVQLLSLLREILTYRGKTKGNNNVRPCVLAMDAIMELPIPPEISKSKKAKDSDTGHETSKAEGVVYNPWPALCSFIWAYPNNDFYHIIFFQMLQSVVLEHHEESLRLILQKSKFLSRAVSSMKDEKLRGVLINCLNLMHLRSKSLPPSAFLHQYLGSHDGWKQHVDLLVDLTLKQQKPINGAEGVVIDLNLGSLFATKLGLSEIDEWDSKTATTLSESSMEDAPDLQNLQQSIDEGETGGGKKKNSNNKKSKKKKKK